MVFFTWIGRVTGNINIFVRPNNCYRTVAHYVEDFLSTIVILFMYLFLRTFYSFSFIEECVGAHSLHTSIQTCGTSIYWLIGFIGNRDSDDFNLFSAEPFVANFLCGWQGLNGVFSCAIYADMISKAQHIVHEFRLISKNNFWCGNMYNSLGNMNQFDEMAIVTYCWRNSCTMCRYFYIVLFGNKILFTPHYS